MQRLSKFSRQCVTMAIRQHFVPPSATAPSSFCRYASSTFADPVSPPIDDQITPSSPSSQSLTPSTSPTRSRKQPRKAPPPLEVTPAAEQRILYLLSQREPRPSGVRIGLRTRGCNGMAYVLNYADDASKFDEKITINGANVYIDPRALMHIVGTKMDFVDNDLVSEFVFHNPNAKGTCGCGESFNV